MVHLQTVYFPPRVSIRHMRWIFRGLYKMDDKINE